MIQGAKGRMAGVKRQGDTGASNRLKAVCNGLTTKYVYDAAGNLLAEADSSGAIAQYYIYGAGLIARSRCGYQAKAILASLS